MIIWSGPIYEISGFGKSARDYIRAFHNCGINIKICPVKYYFLNTEKLLPKKDKELFDSLIIHPKDVIHGQYTFINHCSPVVDINTVDNVKKLLNNSRTHFLFSVWETNHLPNISKPLFDIYRRIFTPSKYSKQAFLNSFPNLDIQVVPHIIHDYIQDNSIPYNDKLVQLKKQGKFIYLANLEWHLGKGYDILLKGFLKAFQDQKDVILILKTYNLSSSGYYNHVLSYIKHLKGDQKFPQILPIIGNATYQDILSLYKSSDCLINMSRREGFGLVVAEALGFRLPIICPDKGGHTEFLNSKNSIMVKSEWADISKIESERMLYKGQQWIESDLEDFIYKLRQFHNVNRDQTVKNLKTEADRTIVKFSSIKIIKKFLSHLEDFS